MKGLEKWSDSHCSSVLFSRSRRRHRPHRQIAVRSAWRAVAIVLAILVGAAIALATIPATAADWELGGTNTTITTTPIVIAQSATAAESSVPAKTSGSAARPVELSRELPKRESSTRDSGGSGDVAAVEPARPSFVSYMALHNAAMRRGGYRPGHVVCIANGVDDIKAEMMQRTCLLNGWSFCMANQPYLLPGFSWHRAADDGTLREIGTKPTTKLARYRPPDAFDDSIPAVIREYRQPVRTVYYADAGGGACADGSCSLQQAMPMSVGYSGGYSSGGSCASGSCGGGQSMGFSSGYTSGGYQGGYSGGGFISRIFGGGGCASGQCGS